jgi:hypothetical protein
LGDNKEVLLRSTMTAREAEYIMPWGSLWPSTYLHFTMPLLQSFDQGSRSGAAGMPKLRLSVLTGHVTKIGSDCFDGGGFSDIWRGNLDDPDTGEVIEV